MLIVAEELSVYMTEDAVEESDSKGSVPEESTAGHSTKELDNEDLADDDISGDNLRGDDTQAVNEEESLPIEDISPEEGESTSLHDAHENGTLQSWVSQADSETIEAKFSTLLSEIHELEEHIEALTTERDDLLSQLKRKQADFENYKKRQEKRREEEQKRATEKLVRKLLEVSDNLTRALETDEDADIREGVEATNRQLEDILLGENVTKFEPSPGDDVDPQRHEVLLQVESEQPDGTIVDVHRPGYEIAEKVLRTAQVTVSKPD